MQSTQSLKCPMSPINPTLASSSELNVAPKTFLQFCELALSEASSSVSAQQAFAWALYRNGKWNECIEILDSDTFRDDPCNGYLLAMAYHHLADQAKASQILQETELLVSSNSKPPKNQPQKFADAKTIAEVALPRLQWEAQGLLGMHDSRKILPPEKE